jgi:integrase/recombinase XerD
MAIIVTLIQPTKRRGVKSQTWFGQWRDERGKLHKKTTGTRDKSVARTIVREWERRLALDAQYIHDFDRYKRLTWAAVVEEFVSLHTGHPATLDLYRRAGKQFDRVAESPLLCRITTAIIEKFAAARSKEVEETTVNKELRHVKAILNWAHESGRRYIREVPKIEFLREDEYLPTVIPVVDYRKILAVLPSAGLRIRSVQWWGVLIRLLWETGIRFGEGLRLTWEKINLDTGVLIAFGKGRKERPVPLLDDFVEVLRQWKSQSTSKEVLPWGRAPRRLYEDWARITKAAGLTGIVPKSFRSSVASQILLAGTNTITTSRITGHDPAVLNRHYANVADGLRPAMEARRRYNDDREAG